MKAPVTVVIEVPWGPGAVKNCGGWQSPAKARKAMAAIIHGSPKAEHEKEELDDQDRKNMAHYAKYRQNTSKSIEIGARNHAQFWRRIETKDTMVLAAEAKTVTATMTATATGNHDSNQ